MRWRRAALALNGTVGVRRSWQGPAPYPTRPPEASRADPCTTVAPGHVLDVVRVADGQVEVALEGGVDRLPVDAGALHADTWPALTTLAPRLGPCRASEEDRGPDPTAVKPCNPWQPGPAFSQGAGALL